MSKEILNAVYDENLWAKTGRDVTNLGAALAFKACILSLVDVSNTYRFTVSKFLIRDTIYRFVSSRRRFLRSSLASTGSFPEAVGGSGCESQEARNRRNLKVSFGGLQSYYAFYLIFQLCSQWRGECAAEEALADLRSERGSLCRSGTSLSNIELCSIITDKDLEDRRDTILRV